MQEYHLRAIDPENNIYCCYEINTMKDLFGRWSLVLSYGRIGSSRRSKVINLEKTQQLMD